MIQVYIYIIYIYINTKDMVFFWYQFDSSGLRWATRGQDCRLEALYGDTTDILFWRLCLRCQCHVGLRGLTCVMGIRRRASMVLILFGCFRKYNTHTRMLFLTLHEACTMRGKVLSFQLGCTSLLLAFQGLGSGLSHFGTHGRTG